MSEIAFLSEMKAPRLAPQRGATRAREEVASARDIGTLRLPHLNAN